MSTTGATELREQKSAHSTRSFNSEAPPFHLPSPFYQYNHDSPRSSADIDSKAPRTRVNVSLRDLEGGSFSLSPSVTQEKKNAQEATRKNKFAFWKRQKQCMTKPKQRGCAWFHSLSARQKIMVKMVIGLLIIGAAVGLAVGISVHVGGGVYKNGNTSSQIGGGG